MQTIGRRIEQLRIERGLKKTDVWKGAGVSSGAYSQWMSGGTVKGETLIKLAKLFNVNPDWLATGKGEKESSNISSAPDIKGHVPVISWVQAGDWMEVIDHLSPGDGERVETTYKARPHTYALRVKGDSMEPRFPEGAILIVEPDESPEPGKFVIVRQNGDTEATFKQLIKDGGQFYLKPLNPRYPIMEMRQDAVFCGVVKFVQMNV